jgi:hypothetical protein
VWIFYINILRIYFLGAFVAVRKVTFSFVCLSLVSTERKNRPLMDGLSLNLVFGKFVEILWCYLKFLQNLLKIGGLLMKTDTHTHTHLYIYIYIYAQFVKYLFEFLSREIYQTDVVEKIKIYFIFSFSQNRAFIKQCGKIWYSRPGHK